MQFIHTTKKSGSIKIESFSFIILGGILEWAWYWIYTKENEHTICNNIQFRIQYNGLLNGLTLPIWCESNWGTQITMAHKRSCHQTIDNVLVFEITHNVLILSFSAVYRILTNLRVLIFFFFKMRNSPFTLKLAIKHQYTILGQPSFLSILPPTSHTFMTDRD